jgi:hypothetical protein
MPSENYPDTVLLNDNSDVASAVVAETRYRWWVRGSATACWRELPEQYTMAEMSRMLREEQFIEFSLIDGSASRA